MRKVKEGKNRKDTKESHRNSLQFSREIDDWMMNCEMVVND